MAIKLPPIAQAKPIAQATEAQTSSVAVYGDTGEEKPATEAPRPAPYKIHDAAGADLGLKTYIPEETAAELPPAQPSVTNIVNHALDVVRFDELARTMLEIRGEVAETERRLHNFLTAELQRHPDAIANLHARISMLDEAHGAQIGGLMADVKKLIVDDNGILEMIRIDAEAAHARFGAIDDALATKGLPTSKSAVTPVLSLRPARVLATKARLAGAVVILCYNPKQGRDGDEPQEFTIREQPRSISTGYTVDVPSGYVCDVFVGADVVAALQGKGESELTVQMRSKSPYGRTVNSGSEICRLALRKMESLRVEIAAVQ